MARNSISAGQVLQHTASADISSGDVVVTGNTIGVALTDIASGETGSVAIEGVFSVPKVSAAVFAQGEALIYDVSAGAFDDAAATPATGDITGGAIAWEAGSNNETTALVKLTPGNAAKA